METDQQASERRRSIRVRHRATFVIRQLLNNGVGDPLTVVLQDLSDTGVGIMHSQAMRSGEQYQIPLVREAAEPMSLVCTVVRCEKLDDGLFNIGMAFNSSPRAINEGRRQLTGRKR